MPLHPEPTRTLRAFALVALAAAGCAGDDRPALRVFAAASLAAPFEQLAARFEASHPELRVQVHCAGTPQLVMQLREGAPADVFASADYDQMQRVVEAGHAAGAPRTFATNTLAIVTPPENEPRIAAVADLGRADVTCLFCAADVPAGRYARDLLAQAGVTARSASDEPSVRAVVSKVELGVADAGIVYRTDALAAGDRVRTVAIPEHYNVVGSYPIVATTTGSQKEAGHAFVLFVLGAEGRQVLADHGFAAP